VRRGAFKGDTPWERNRCCRCGASAPVPKESRAIDGLTLCGLVAVTAMLITYALEDRSAWFILGFAAACVLGSVYGFLQGAWPFGLVEAVWALVALRRWTRRRRPSGET
jgi:hypothetical protein